MAPVTRVALKALDRLGGPRILLAAVPGGSRSVAAEAGVSRSRVSQVLREEPLPREWAQLFASLIGCEEWEVYQQLGQRAPGSPYGPLFDEARPKAGRDDSAMIEAVMLGRQVTGEEESG